MKLHTKIVAFLLVLMAGTSLYAQSGKWNPSEFLSPDEGVLIYGIGTWLKDVGVSQINLEKKPAYIIPQVKSNAMCGSLLCFPPVEKGVLLTPYATREDPKKLSSKQVITRMTAEYKPLAAVADPFAKDIMGKGLTEEDVYYLPYIPTEKKVDTFEIGIFESQAHFKNGDMFFANYTATKTGNFCFTFPIQYFFHGDPNLLIYLPSDFMVSVPKGEKYIYIGDFEFFVEGHDFGVVKVNHTDNYDGAKEEVRRLFGDKAVLSRAELLPVDTEDESYIENLTVVTYYYY